MPGLRPSVGQKIDLRLLGQIKQVVCLDHDHHSFHLLLWAKSKLQLSPSLCLLSSLKSELSVTFWLVANLNRAYSVWRYLSAEHDYEGHK